MDPEERKCGLMNHSNDPQKRNTPQEEELKTGLKT